MKTTVQWNDTGPTSVALSQPGPGLVRLLGLPFVAAGGYFLYQFLGGVLHPGELTIAGWILLPVMAAVFLVPGWMIAAFRKRTELDSARREATEVFDFLVFTHRKRTAVPSDAHAMLRYERGSERTTKGAVVNQTHTTFQVHVYLTAGTTLVLLAMFNEREKAAAMAFAQKVASFFAIDVQDRCVEGGEITSGGVVVEKLDADEAD